MNETNKDQGNGQGETEFPIHMSLNRYNELIRERDQARAQLKTALTQCGQNIAMIDKLRAQVADLLAALSLAILASRRGRHSSAGRGR